MIAVLYARRDSVYKSLPELDVYDADRDARTYNGKGPVIAHPPCRLWGRLAKFAKSADEEREREHGRHAVRNVREHGGVLEHPQQSKLWDEMNMPKPGEEPDVWGGYTISVDQWWWGHRAHKATWLYIVGCRPKDLPPIPFRIGRADHVINTGIRKTANSPLWRPEVTKREREATPELFALWLVEVARKCGECVATSR